MSNNFDPSKLNVDFSNLEEENNKLENKEDTSNIMKKSELISEDDIKKSKEEEKEKKEKQLEEFSTILIDPEIRPEELKEKDKGSSASNDILQSKQAICSE